MKLKNTPHDIFYYSVVALSTLAIIAWVFAIVSNIVMILNVNEMLVFIFFSYLYSEKTKIQCIQYINPIIAQVNCGLQPLRLIIPMGLFRGCVSNKEYKSKRASPNHKIRAFLLLTQI